MAKVKSAAAKMRAAPISRVKRVLPAALPESEGTEFGGRNVSADDANLQAPSGDIAEVARKHAVRAIERIAEIMECESNREALAAAFHLLDRAYGKPAGLPDDKNSMNEVMLGLRESLRAKLARILE